MKIKFYDEVRDFVRMKSSMEKTELAVSRLENPYGLDDDKILMYQDYLFNYAQDTVHRFIDNNRVAIFPLLVKYRVIKKSNIIQFTDYARDKKKLDILSYLMEAGNLLRTGSKKLNLAKKHTPGKSALPPADGGPDWQTAKTGDILWFGIQPVPWQVLERKDNILLLISKYVLECKPYTNFYRGFTTWSRCSIRLKFQTDYMESLFTEEEKSMMVPVYINDEDDSLTFGPVEKTEQDKLFLLSEKEVCRYMRTERERFAPLTKYSMRTPMWTIFDQYAYWWTRSPGTYPIEKTYVRDGKLTSANSIVNGDDCFDFFGVRPAVYIRIK